MFALAIPPFHCGFVAAIGHYSRFAGRGHLLAWNRDGGDQLYSESTNQEASHTVVNINGQLLGECVCVAEVWCIQALSSRKAGSVFLRDVFAIDDADCNLLCRLSRMGSTCARRASRCPMSS